MTGTDRDQPADDPFGTCGALKMALLDLASAATSVHGALRGTPTGRLTTVEYDRVHDAFCTFFYANMRHEQLMDDVTPALADDGEAS